MPLVFSYGTLQQPEVQLSTFGRRLHGRPDALVGFERSVVKIDAARLVATSGEAYHANVTFNGRSDSRVNGTVFEITDAELTAAVGYEQRASYQRIATCLASGERTWVYVAARTAPDAP